MDRISPIKFSKRSTILRVERRHQVAPLVSMRHMLYIMPVVALTAISLTCIGNKIEARFLIENSTHLVETEALVKEIDAAVFKRTRKSFMKPVKFPAQLSATDEAATDEIKL